MRLRKAGCIVPRHGSQVGGRRVRKVLRVAFCCPGTRRFQDLDTVVTRVEKLVHSCNPVYIFAAKSAAEPIARYQRERISMTLCDTRMKIYRIGIPALLLLMQVAVTSAQGQNQITRC